MTTRATRYGWTELSSVPNVPGIYAWYYVPEFTERDLQETINEIRELTARGASAEAERVLNEFLHRRLFRVFAEEPYQVRIRGPLKPTYEGDIEHQMPTLTRRFVDRVLEDPSRLATIKEVLETTAPEFSSPIYIGMSERLQERLAQHRNLIHRYRARQLNIEDSTEIESELKLDKSFALQVVRRSLVPTRLFVFVQTIEDDGSMYINIENLLNRICYPILGRN